MMAQLARSKRAKERIEVECSRRTGFVVAQPERDCSERLSLSRAGHGTR